MFIIIIIFLTIIIIIIPGTNYQVTWDISLLTYSSHWNVSLSYFFVLLTEYLSPYNSV